CCAGPNICTACLAPLIVTLLNRTVAGLHKRFGATTASSEVKPSLLLVRAWAKADSAALPRGPMMRSIWATSLPSPTSDSPTHNLVIFAMAISSRETANTNLPAYAACVRQTATLVFSVRHEDAGPVGRIAAGPSPQPESIIVIRRRQDAMRTRS